MKKNLLIVAVICLAAINANANLLGTDGDFESGGWGTYWYYHTANMTVVNTDSSSGAFSMQANFGIGAGNAATANAGWIVAPDLAGQHVQLQLDFKAVNDGVPGGYMQLQMYDGAWGSLGAPWVALPSSTNGGWQTVTLDIAAVPAGFSHCGINLAIWNDTTAGVARIDNVRLSAVPEPATMSLLGLGALAFLRRK